MKVILYNDELGPDFTDEPGGIPSSREVIEVGHGPDGRLINDPFRGNDAKYRAQPCAVCGRRVPRGGRIWYFYRRGGRDIGHYRCWKEGLNKGFHIFPNDDPEVDLDQGLKQGEVSQLHLYCDWYADGEEATIVDPTAEIDKIKRGQGSQEWSLNHFP